MVRECYIIREDLTIEGCYDDSLEFKEKIVALEKENIKFIVVSGIYTSVLIHHNGKTWC
jgi:hypothetical protein